jgi:hypothetical protein
MCKVADLLGQNATAYAAKVVRPKLIGDLHRLEFVPFGTRVDRNFSKISDVVSIRNEYA